MRASADGYVTLVTLTVGDRALPSAQVMSCRGRKRNNNCWDVFTEMAPDYQRSAPVDIVFDNRSRRIYHAKITAIPKGIGQGQVAVSGTLARTTALGGTTAFSRRDINSRRNWSRLTTARNVRRRRNLCRKGGRNRPACLHSGMDKLLCCLPTSKCRVDKTVRGKVRRCARSPRFYSGAGYWPRVRSYR